MPHSCRFGVDIHVYVQYMYMNVWRPNESITEILKIEYTCVRVHVHVYCYMDRCGKLVHHVVHVHVHVHVYIMYLGRSCTCTCNSCTCTCCGLRICVAFCCLVSFTCLCIVMCNHCVGGCFPLGV